MRKLALFLGFVAAAAGVWFMVSGARRPAPLSAVPADEAWKGGSDTLGPRQPEAKGASDIITPTADRIEVEPTDTPAGQRELVRVLVTRKDTGEPIPGAEVSYYETFDARDLSEEEEAEYRRIFRDWEKLTERYGSTVTAGDDGVAFVPVESSVRATSRHADLYGRLPIRRDPDASEQSEYRLELVQEVVLRVQVLDAGGNPAVGVPIELLPRYDVVGARAVPRELGITEAPEGIAELAHLERVFGSRPGRNPAPVDYLLRPDVPGLLDGTAIDPEDLPESPVVFRLPPTGRIVAEFKRSNGDRIGGSVTLAVAPTESLEENARFDAPPDQQWRRNSGPDGAIVFDRVVTGRTWVASANPGESFQRVFPGPLVEDQEVRLQFALKWGPYRVTGRVLDETGTPLRFTSLMHEYALKEGRSGMGGGTRTDERGYFEYTVSGDDNLTADPTLTRFDLNDRATGVTYTWRGELTLVAEGNDLGDLLPNRSTLIATGRVLVDGAKPGQERFGLSVDFAGDGRASRFGMSTMSRNAGLDLRFLPDGRFEIRGEATEARYLLIHRDPMYLPLRPIEFGRGDELTVELQRGGSMEATVLIDADVPRSELQARLLPTDGQVPEVRRDPRDRATMIMSSFTDSLVAGLEGPDGRTLQWPALWPGRYRMEVNVHGARAPVAAVEGVLIKAGERNAELRVQPIDLRGKLRTIDVTLLDLDGNPLDPMEDRIVVSINDSDRRRFFERTNPQTILVSDSDLDLVVGAQGYRSRELFGVTDDIEVMLEPYPEIAIKIAGGPPTLPQDYSLTVSIREVRDSSQPVAARTSASRRVASPIASKELPGSGQVTLQVATDGRHRVRLQLSHKTRLLRAIVRGVEPAEIEVNTALGQQVFEIRIPEQSLRQAVEEAERRR